MTTLSEILMLTSRVFSLRACAFLCDTRVEGFVCCAREEDQNWRRVARRMAVFTPDCPGLGVHTAVTTHDDGTRPEGHLRRLVATMWVLWRPWGKMK